MFFNILIISLKKYIFIRKNKDKFRPKKKLRIKFDLFNQIAKKNLI